MLSLSFEIGTCMSFASGSKNVRRARPGPLELLDPLGLKLPSLDHMLWHVMFRCVFLPSEVLATEATEA